MANLPANATYPTPTQLLQTIINAIVFASTAQGLPASNVLPGSDQYIRAQAYASRIAIAIANNQISEAQSNPLTATGTDLATLAGLFGVQARPAAPSAGSVTIVVTSGTVNIPSGFVGSTPDGQTFQTAQTYAGLTNGASVNVIASSPGAASNESNGTTLTWSSAAIGNLGPVATVGSGGLVGGADADNDDRLRARLLQKLSAPALGGNWSSVVEWAENASASVEAAYVIAAARGPSSYNVVVTAPGGKPTFNNSGRILAQPTLDIVRAAILANMPGQQDLLVTAVADQPAWIVMSLSLPLPTGAGGVGGGWRDPIPWPAERAQIINYDPSSGLLTVDAVHPPVAGNNIGIWAPGMLGAPGPAMMEFSVLGPVAGSTHAWTFTTQPAIGSLGGTGTFLIGSYISAGAVSLIQYAQTFAQGVWALGPGELTNLPELLPRSRRQPSTDLSTAPRSEISTRILSTLENAFPEIIDISYDAVWGAGPTLQTPPYVPAVAAATSLPPFIWNPVSIAFWKQ